MRWLVIASLLAVSLLTEGDATFGCDYLNGNIPERGHCLGPVHRAIQKRAAYFADDRNASGRNCTGLEEQYLKDGNTTDVRCAPLCIPGSDRFHEYFSRESVQDCQRTLTETICVDSDVFLARGSSCRSDTTCSDEGTCIPFRSLRLFGQNCTVDHHCGPGLQCSNNICQRCREGHVLFGLDSLSFLLGPLASYVGGIRCLRGEYRVTSWSDVWTHPRAAILASMAIFTLSLATLVCTCMVMKATKANIKDTSAELKSGATEHGFS